ncbi:MAG TPA: RNA polymerase sigma factor [Candidatus Limnocylindrales bacterium]|nr:RNA polymerase sigma factor [Candidatus Limnocylindrales bacterium]
MDDTRLAAGASVALVDAEGPGGTLTADEVFASLTRRQVDAAFRLAWAILGDPGDAEDAAQDAFAMAWRKRSSLRDVAKFEPWFQAILVNTCRERLRQRGRSRVRAVEAVPEHGVSDDSVQVGIRAEVGGALAGLDPEHRIVVVLRYWADLTVDEIAERVGVPAGTVKSRLHYALKTLHTELEGVR